LLSGKRLLLALELARVDLYATWQWLMGMTCLWAVFAGICLAPIAQLTYEGQQPAAAATTGAMKFFIRSLSGTVGILVAAIVIDRSTTGGLEYVRASVVQGQGTLQVVEPALRTHMATVSTPASCVSTTAWNSSIRCSTSSWCSSSRLVMSSPSVCLFRGCHLSPRSSSAALAVP
jgi:hypothetical protein